MFWRAFERYFSFIATTPRSRVRLGGRPDAAPPPPPVDHGSFVAPARRELTHDLWMSEFSTTCWGKGFEPPSC